ncbi:MAG: aspartate aminotransferase family protein [bacterium]|nr:aspartate aminotransferase family protein [bacterium]MDE0602256.1 aspartate aminotransferase family protein [bacterium]
MDKAQIATALRRELDRYRGENPLSVEMSHRARKVLPGGTTRTTTYFPPFPPFLVLGEGCHIVDVDGNRRVDFLNNYTSLICGHAHPDILKAAQGAQEGGTAFSAPTEYEVVLAEMLCERVDSLDLVRFTNSGTEATMAALRVARAYTGRSKVARFEGSYHGTHDYANVPAPGVPPELSGLVVDLPFNDEEGCRKVLEEVGHELAAIIIEPVLGAAGYIPARPDFLRFLREATTADGSVLIFDEVQTLRLHRGGAQAIYGVSPDLSAFAKIIGGGFPVGAFGGAGEIMETMNPVSGDISWGGTFNGNPVTAAAGVACLEMLTEAAINRLNQLGERAMEGINRVFAEKEFPGQVTGMGSLFNVHPTAEPVEDVHAVKRIDPDLKRVIHFGLLNRGYFLSSRVSACISTPMTNAEVDGLVSATADIIENLPG